MFDVGVVRIGVADFASFLASCSASLPGGNLVDGLPPVVNNHLSGRV